MATGRLSKTKTPVGPQSIKSFWRVPSINRYPSFIVFVVSSSVKILCEDGAVCLSRCSVWRVYVVIGMRRYGMMKGQCVREFRWAETAMLLASLCMSVSCIFRHLGVIEFDRASPHGGDLLSKSIK